MKTLGEIQSIGPFDFRKSFVSGDLLRAIFDIKVKDAGWECMQGRMVSQDKA